MLTPQALNLWITIASGFLKLGGELKTLFSASGVTPEQEAQILAALADDNARRRAISAAIADL